LRIGDLRELVANRPYPADRRQALLRVIGMLLDMRRDQRLEQPPVLRPQEAAPLQVLGQRLVLGQHPRLHARDELLAGNEIHLQGQNAKQQIAIAGHGHAAGISGYSTTDREWP
jgi:hypothetical protein